MTELDVELALDRLEGRLATELTAHVAALAAGEVTGALRISDREVATVRAAEDSAALHARGIRVLRVIAPIVIEGDPRVAALRAAAPTWDGWRALVAARDAVAQARFGRGHRALVHALAGIAAAEAGGAPLLPPPIASPADAGRAAPPEAVRRSIDGWTARGAALDDGAILAMWRAQTRGAPYGALTITRRADVHPRMFAIERGVRGTIVVAAVVDTPAARFAVLHELGHALLWLAPAARGVEWPRGLDEAVASRVARVMEDPASPWFSPLATRARARRLALARALDAIERGAPTELARPPWALWNDPHAQAIYVAAEAVADTLALEAGVELLAHRA